MENNPFNININTNTYKFLIKSLRPRPQESPPMPFQMKIDSHKGQINSLNELLCGANTFI